MIGKKDYEEILKIFKDYGYGDKKEQVSTMENIKNKMSTIPSNKLKKNIFIEDERFIIHNLEEKFQNKYDVQNKFIKLLNKEVESLKSEIEELMLQAKMFQSTLTYQSDAMTELQKKLNIDNLTLKINKIEKNGKNKNTFKYSNRKTECKKR
jgi:hypothetical protein